ncbi:TetR/AcrR family transcriptional regulator [Salinibacterium soli]|uniref:TetR/AcrR family transcriptional regulator n=1 Tax=Antiquaquibacter soli TaxID=3064523 RepID=A0ABT9BP95_9MICO|nr:TetR/AcrR family transcriptional regulator [Protaetiibacter sp. WY-16]MDO7882248.1 TetR/AcrR family transcriptional regulator [Protaetiibacter sp. WY-16]
MSRAGVDERISFAALDLLRSRGPSAVSVESVAAHSGVAKTTIYRRFENRDELLAAAVVSATRPIDLPEGLSAEDTVRWALRHARDMIENVVGRGALAAVMADGDPVFRDVLLGMIRASIGPLRHDLRAEVADGELRADLDIELVLSVLMGAVIAEMIRGRPTDDEWVESVLGLLWPGLSGPGRRAR